MILPFFFAYSLAASDTAFNDPDSLRSEALALAADGQLEAALALVEGLAPALAPATVNGLKGRLEWRGEAARKALESAASDGSDSTARGESLFLLGQLHSAAGRHHLAIPRFREYLAYFPDGNRSEAARFWMAYACLRFVLGNPGKTAYLDSGLRHLDSLDSQTRPSGYYQPLGAGLRARLLARQSDSGFRIRSLIPEVGKPAVKTGIPNHDTMAARTPGFTLQLGSFALSPNAELLRRRLAVKGVAARLEKSTGSDGKDIYRVLYGSFPRSEEAQKEGERIFGPLGYVFIIAPLRQ